MITKEAHFGRARFIDLTADAYITAPDAGGAMFVTTNQNANGRAIKLPAAQKRVSSPPLGVNVQGNTGFVFLIYNSHATFTLRIKNCDGRNLFTLAATKFSRIFLESTGPDYQGTWRMQTL